MSEYKTTWVPGTLKIKYINGRFGPFPVANIATSFGTFLCKDPWLESLAEGSYDGNFEIGIIKIVNYKTNFEPTELRVTQMIEVNNYLLDNHNDEIVPDIKEDPRDPLEEEPKTLSKNDSKYHSNDEALIAEDDEEIINDHIKSEIPWRMGDDLSIPSELDRLSQRKCRDILVKNGYKLIDVSQRLWGKKHG